MIRRHVHWGIAALLIIMVAGACIVRTRAPARRARPVYVPVEKHQKHQKHKKHHDHHDHR